MPEKCVSNFSDLPVAQSRLVVKRKRGQDGRDAALIDGLEIGINILRGCERGQQGNGQ